MTTTTIAADDDDDRDDDQPAGPMTFGRFVAALVDGDRKADVRAFQQRLATTGLHGKTTTTTQEDTE